MGKIALLFILRRITGVRRHPAASNISQHVGRAVPGNVVVGRAVPGNVDFVGPAVPGNLGCFMRCPFCHLDNDRVIDTRATDEGYVIRRKRVCSSCHQKFLTQERLEKDSVRVVKRDQTREPFSREKIRRGIERACSKRPISSQQIEILVQDIETEVYNAFELEVPTSQIGEIVMRQLARTDEVAYIRFASVYREFEDARDFFNAIEAFRAADTPK